MASVQVLVSAAAYITGCPRSRVNQYARRLIDAGIWEKAVGRSVPSIPESQVLRLIACVAFAERISDAPNISDAFVNLPLRNKNGELPEEFFPNNSSLLVQFTGMLMDRHLASSTLTLSMTTAGAVANIETEFYGRATDATTPEEKEPEFVAQLRFGENLDWGGFSMRSFVVSSEGMNVLGGLLMRPEDEHVEAK